MKIIKLSFLFLLFTFVSCSKDDDSVNIDPDVNIAGVWEMVNYHLDNGKITYSFEGQNFSYNYTVKGKDYDYQVIFSEDPNYVTSSGSYTSVVTTSFLGQSDTQEIPISTDDIEGEIIGGTWSIEGTKFITVVEETETSMDIRELTENRMKLQIDLADAELLGLDLEDMELEGIDVKISGKINITLERN